MCAALVALALAARPLMGGDVPGAGGATPHLYPPFAHAPLDGPLIVTGTFGEYRPGRFHAGMDYSTGGSVGMPVYAPVSGWMERVRASGAGYGRSLYLHAEDGRLILLGHLDAYDEPFATAIAAAQDSSGQYEQDLWFERDKFPVAAGQRLGWSGQSGGVGEPHLHLEVRRGDMAIHPLLAGASAVDTIPPVILAIAIEPRDGVSRVDGAFAPRRLALGARPETVSVTGRARVEVDANDPGTRRSNMQPYEIEMAWGGQTLACRFDSLSWATDMVEGDLVYDRGRIFGTGAHAVPLWAPAGFRPRAIVTSVPLAREAGTLDAAELRGPQRVRITARDFGGHTAVREFVAKLAPAAPDSATARPDRTLGGAFARCEWKLPATASFGAGTGWDSVRAETLGVPAAAGDLVPVGGAIRIAPDWLPRRAPAELRVRRPAREVSPRLGLYSRRDGDWELVTAKPDSSHDAWLAEPMHLGAFALFEDRAAPRILLRRPPRHRGAAEPYSRWALEAKLTEMGSGVDVRGSYFVVDGQRRPSEWDGVHQTLRWKPRRAPASGVHHVTVVAADKAGNTRQVTGRFVLD